MLRALVIATNALPAVAGDLRELTALAAAEATLAPPSRMSLTGSPGRHRRLARTGQAFVSKE
jgi:hypothetical protein